MNAKLELYRRYYCVYRNIHPFSILIEWADAYILQIGYEDHIYELSLVKNESEALSITEEILNNILPSNQSLNILPISDRTSMFDTLPKNSEYATLLGKSYNRQEYQLDSILIYQLDFEEDKQKDICSVPITLSTFQCNKWIKNIYTNRDKIRQALFTYWEKHYSNDFCYYKDMKVLDYLYNVIGIYFYIKSNSVILLLRQTDFEPEEYELPKLKVEYISIELDRNINIISIE